MGVCLTARLESPPRYDARPQAGALQRAGRPAGRRYVAVRRHKGARLTGLIDRTIGEADKIRQGTGLRFPQEMPERVESLWKAC